MKEFLLFTGVIAADEVKIEAALLMEEFVLRNDGVYLTRGPFGVFVTIVGLSDSGTFAPNFVLIVKESDLFCGATTGTRAVSYTHLDVYKRQVY